MRARRPLARRASQRFEGIGTVDADQMMPDKQRSQRALNYFETDKNVLRKAGGNVGAATASTAAETLNGSSSRIACVGEICLMDSLT